MIKVKITINTMVLCYPWGGEDGFLDDIIEKLRENLKKLKTDREEKINLIKERSNSLCKKINDTFDKEYQTQKKKLDKEIENLKQEISQKNISLLQIYNDKKNSLTEKYKKEILELKNLLATEERELEKAKQDLSKKHNLDDIQREINECKEYLSVYKNLSVYKKQMLSIDKHHRNHENEHSIDTMKTLYEEYFYKKQMLSIDKHHRNHENEHLSFYEEQMPSKNEHRRNNKNEHLSFYKKQMLFKNEHRRNNKNEHSIDTMKKLYELYRYIKKIKGEENTIDEIDNLYKDLCVKTNELSSLNVSKIEDGMNRVIDVIIKSISKINDHVSFSRSEAKKNNVYFEIDHKCEAVMATSCIPCYIPLTILSITGLGRYMYNKPNKYSEQKYKNELRTFLNNKSAVSELIKVLVGINNESLQQNNVLDRRSSGASTPRRNQL